MNNDKAFAAYALLLFVGVITMLTVTVTLLGTGSWPTPLHLAEHVSLGLLMRASYKWIGGWNSADWSVTSDRVREASEALAPAGDTADAMG